MAFLLTCTHVNPSPTKRNVHASNFWEKICVLLAVLGDQKCGHANVGTYYTTCATYKQERNCLLYPCCSFFAIEKRKNLSIRIVEVHFFEHFTKHIMYHNFVNREQTFLYNEQDVESMSWKMLLTSNLQFCKLTWIQKKNRQIQQAIQKLRSLNFHEF